MKSIHTVWIGFLVGIISLSAPLSYISAAASMSISGVSADASANAGAALTFTIVTPEFVSPTFTLSDSFGGTSASAGLISSSGIFTWTPATSDVGTHNFTFFASDTSGHSGSVTQSITVVSVPTVTISSLLPGATLSQTQTDVSFTATANGFVSSPTFTLSDSFSGTTITNANITSNGLFTWAPGSTQGGTHTITVTATDATGRTASVTQVITVQRTGASIQSLSPGASVSSGIQVTFTVVPTGFTNPVYVVADSFSGTSASSSVINSSTGAFSWTPTVADGGTHTFTITVTDSTGRAATVTQQITVAVTQSANITGLTPGSTVSVGTLVSFGVTGTGLSSPSYFVFDPFGGSTITQKNINSSTGAFSWTPSAVDVGVHNVVVQASTAAGQTVNIPVAITVQGSTAASATAVSAVAKTPAAVTASTATPLFTRNLASGSVGEDVRALQKILQDGGFLNHVPTGSYGALTVAAVKKFQLAHGIAQLGNVGPATRAALNALAAPSRPQAIALLKAQILEAKIKLAELESQLAKLEATQ